ncbi:acetyl-CoA synthetase-like protein [Aspergillus karnatakaensis]|uniref:acetyl-CoA synthetase-like protein n=1 Tax=Aspergillus karnatakaensis TaxID=1810916 RepID=UPI003CCCCCA4
MSGAVQANAGLAQVLWQRLNLFGGDIAIKEGSESLTFRGLHDRALVLMRSIHKIGIRPEEPIGILTSRRLDHIICQAAVIYAGATAVPLDIGLADDHIAGLLRHLKTSLLLTDTQNDSRLPSLQHVLVDIPAPETNGCRTGHVGVSDNSPSSCTHILHTSGSTGKPKAVRVLGKGLLNLVFNKFSPVSRGSRVGQACNIGFDVSLWEIWSSLLQGGILVVLSRHDTLDVSFFRQKIRDEKISVMWQTTSLLATVTHIAPDSYSTVDTLLTGGEAINIQTVRKLFANSPPRRLFNVYGPTELSVFTAYHEVSRSEVDHGNIPIGQPLSGYEAFVVDDDLRPVPDGEIGELVVGGEGVAGGYFDNAEKTAAVFVSAPHLSSTGLLYRTGDLVRRNDSGLLEYLGRRDSEVKIRGQRVDLQSVERCLLDTKLVSAAVALKVADRSGGGSALLVAYVVPSTPDADAKSIQGAYVKRALNMMTPRIKVVDGVTLTRSGKVDRLQLAREYQDELERAQTATSRGETECVTIEDHLRQFWGEILGLSSDTFSQKDDFFALGGTSLHAARLVFRINQVFDASVPVAALFESPTLSGMCDEVRKVRSGVEGATEEIPLWVKDMELGKDIRRVDDWLSDTEGRVFLTGATGFVGAYLLMGLLSHPKVQRIACLVRAEDQSHALLRIRHCLKRFGPCLQPEHEPKIVPIAGDIAQDDLGLGRDQYQQWAEWSSVVFHLAAHVNFVQPYSSHRAINVVGTLNVLHFSQAVRSKTLHYTSSISAYGPTGLVTGCKQLFENEPPESHKIALSYDTGYAQSQFAAETIIWDAIRNGLPVAIYRLGSVLGHSDTGRMNSDDFISRLVRTCIQNGAYPSLPGHREEFVPVDFVVSSILQISSKAGNLGRAYNIVHPHQSSLSLPALFHLINEHSGKRPLQRIAYADWLGKIKRIPEHPLSSVMPMLEEPVWDGRSRWQMQQDMPEFSTENLRRALSDETLSKCLSPSDLVKLYVPHWVKEAGI